MDELTREFLIESQEGWTAWSGASPIWRRARRMPPCSAISSAPCIPSREPLDSLASSGSKSWPTPAKTCSASCATANWSPTGPSLPDFCNCSTACAPSSSPSRPKPARAKATTQRSSSNSKSCRLRPASPGSPASASSGTASSRPRKAAPCIRLTAALQRASARCSCRPVRRPPRRPAAAQPRASSP